MISRYSFGKPFETEALVVKIEATEGKLPFFRTDGEGNYYYDFDDKDKRKILNFIDAVSSSIPFDDIYNSVCNKNNTTELEDEQLEAIILEGVAQFKRIKSLIQKGNDEVMVVLSKYEPFNDEKIAGRIKEIIENENT